MRNIWLVGLCVLGICSIVIVPIGSWGDTIEREWIKTDTDLILGGGQYYTGYLKLNKSDVVTVNWKDGDVPDGPDLYVQIGIYTVGFATTYSGLNASKPEIAGLGESGVGYFGFNYQARTVLRDALFYPIKSPQTFWMEVIVDQIIRIDFLVTKTLGSQTFNLTITPGNDSAETQMKNLATAVSELNETVTNLKNDLTTIKVKLDALENELSSLAMNESLDIAYLLSLIESLNTSLSQAMTKLEAAMASNDTVLIDRLATNITEISNQLSLLNNTINERISNIPIYNDTSIRGELDKVKRSIENISIINQTVVNQTLVNTSEIKPTSYVNKTIENPTRTDYVTAAIAGILGGLLGSILTVGVMTRRPRPELEVEKGNGGSNKKTTAESKLKRPTDTATDEEE